MNLRLLSSRMALVAIVFSATAASADVALPAGLDCRAKSVGEACGLGCRYCGRCARSGFTCNGLSADGRPICKGQNTEERCKAIGCAWSDRGDLYCKEDPSACPADCARKSPKAQEVDAGLTLVDAAEPKAPGDSQGGWRCASLPGAALGLSVVALLRWLGRRTRPRSRREARPRS